MISPGTLFSASLTCWSTCSLIFPSSTLKVHVGSFLALVHLLDLVVFHLSHR
jgi:hypothetical protein